MGQFIAMYSHLSDSKWEDRKFQAAIAGIDLEKEVKKQKAKSSLQSQQGVLLFKDPKDYEKLSKEEREKMTQDMMGLHKSWAKGQVEGMKVNE